MAAEEKYLQEAVRLAELRLGDQIAAAASYERKAVVFTTSSVAVLGYLLGKGFADESWLAAFALLFLAAAAVYGIVAIWPQKLGTPGLPPEDSWKDAPDAVALMIECMGVYQEKIEIGDETLRKKEIALKISISLFCIGAMLPVIFALSEIAGNIGD